MRLNAYLARAGVASRRKADELIKAGRVTVNGEPGELNTFVQARDRVEVDGRAVRAQKLTYVLLHKPAGFVTTVRDPQGRPTVIDLVDVPERVVPVGRLDADTTGALVLEDGMPAPATVRCLAPGRLELTLHEGRNRQVKRMLDAVGHPVRRLHRSTYAGLTLEGLEPGAWRELDR